MPRAGFYAIHATRIRFGRDGNWYADDEQITNKRIADLFSRHVARDPAGGYMLRMGDERAHIEVDDTPYVVTDVSMEPDDHVSIQLNDGSTEPLETATLQVGADNVLYCRVKNGSEPARFLRSAYYQLVPHISDAGNGEIVLDAGGSQHRFRVH